MTIKNPQLSIEALDLLEKKIEANIAIAEDYEILDSSFLSSIGSEGNILKLFKEYNIHSYEAYVIERNKPLGQRNMAANGILYGSILGAISVLKDRLKNRI